MFDNQIKQFDKLKLSMLTSDLLSIAQIEYSLITLLRFNNSLNQQGLATMDFRLAG